MRPQSLPPPPIISLSHSASPPHPSPTNSFVVYTSKPWANQPTSDNKQQSSSLLSQQLQQYRQQVQGQGQSQQRSRTPFGSSPLRGSGGGSSGGVGKAPVSEHSPVRSHPPTQMQMQQHVAQDSISYGGGGVAGGSSSGGGVFGRGTSQQYHPSGGASGGGGGLSHDGGVSELGSCVGSAWVSSSSTRALRRRASAGSSEFYFVDTLQQQQQQQAGAGGSYVPTPVRFDLWLWSGVRSLLEFRKVVHFFSFSCS